MAAQQLGSDAVGTSFEGKVLERLEYPQCFAHLVHVNLSHNRLRSLNGSVVSYFGRFHWLLVRVPCQNCPRSLFCRYRLDMLVFVEELDLSHNHIASVDVVVVAGTLLSAIVYFLLAIRSFLKRHPPLYLSSSSSSAARPEP